VKEAVTPLIVCLCGSTRFKTLFLAAAAHEALAGRIVLMPGVFSQADEKLLSGAQVAQLGKLHRRKIDMADEVLVIDPGGYVGDATTEEINYAQQLGKTVRRWSELADRVPAGSSDPAEDEAQNASTGNARDTKSTRPAP
jgi:hypothetical protein